MGWTEMEIDQQHKRQIEKIISQMQCSKDFKCYRQKFTNLSKVRDIGMETFVECLEEQPQQCEFLTPFGYKYFCKCPLRVYVAKNLEK